MYRMVYTNGGFTLLSLGPQIGVADIRQLCQTYPSCQDAR